MRLLCLTFGFLSAAATCLAQPGAYENEIAAFEAADRQTPPPKGAILFMGSSSIRLWKTLAEDFPEHQVINRGFGGSQIVDNTRFIDRIAVPYLPRLIVFYCGGNDLNGGRSPEQVAADFREFAAEIRRRLPETRLAYISIAGNPARWGDVEKVRAANAHIAAIIAQDPKMQFVDIFPHMLGADGLPRPELFVADKLHMSPAGYRIWAQIVRPHLSALSK